MGHKWAPTLAFVSSENTVNHSELANIHLKTFSLVSNAHGAKKYTIKSYFMYVSAFRAADSMSSDATKNYEIRNRYIFTTQNPATLKPLRKINF